MCRKQRTVAEDEMHKERTAMAQELPTSPKTDLLWWVAVGVSLLALLGLLNMSMN